MLALQSDVISEEKAAHETTKNAPTTDESLADMKTQMQNLEELGQYTDRVEGLGCLKDAQGHYIKVKIHRDSTVHPRIQRSQRFPPKMQRRVNREVKQLHNLDLIEKVEKPPTWLNPLIPVDRPNQGGIRLCVDMRAANTAVIREPYQIPTIEEVSQKLKGCKYFTKLDLNKGYHQILLDEESRDLTAFQCHLGIFRYKRLIFGLSSAAEIYQREIELALNGLPCVNISDDIIIGGKSKIQLKFRQNLVLERLRERNLTINIKKSKFMKKSVLYMGHTLSAHGISPDKLRVAAINGLAAPENVKELQSFLGMVTYCSKFLPNFSTVTEPLRRLLKKDMPWVWAEPQNQAFEELKRLLLSSETLAFFDPDAYTEIITDASPVGLGAVILQKQKDGHMHPVDYASRSLKSAETRYSQIERECLGIYFAVNRFRNYLYGMDFTVKTDHKPLVNLFKPTSKPPPRIENWILRLMSYKFKVVYHSGKENGADYLSRSNPLHVHDKSYGNEDYIHAILNAQLPKSVPKETIQEETKKDTVLQQIIEFLHNGTFDRTNECLKPYYANRFNFSLVDDLLIYNNRIVIPASLQNQMIVLAHEGHQGMTKTISHLRQTVWWPKMKECVEKFVESCHDCQVVSSTLPNPTPLKMTEIPPESWLMVGCDLCGPFPSGESLLVCVDYHSRYPETEIVRSVKTSVIVDRLRKMFCRYGAPETLVTDNGPQFISAEFKELMTEFNIQHRRVTPYHPIANGEVERFNRSLKKCIQTAISEGINWRVALQTFLLNYRTTPHSTTGVPPSELFLVEKLEINYPKPKNYFLKAKM